MHRNSTSPTRKFLAIVGTRPEVIKMTPLVRELSAQPWAEVHVISTGQHASLLHETAQSIGLRLDEDLQLMSPGQSLEAFAGACLHRLGLVLRAYKPDVVLAQGDTTTTFAASLSAFYAKTRFAHIEAGLRTGDLSDPYPEEAHRKLVSITSTWHFCPTQRSKSQLLNEGVDESRIHVTGNTVIDALRMPVHEHTCLPAGLDLTKKTVLLTTHRRESFGEPIRRIFHAARSLSEKHSDIQVVLPVHPNPEVAKALADTGLSQSRVLLLPALGYLDFVALLKRAHLVLSDSGGIQEEACFLGKPTLILRELTERTEGIKDGPLRLIGNSVERIVGEASKLLTCANSYESLARSSLAFGDGSSAQKMTRIFERELFEQTPRGAELIAA